MIGGKLYSGFSYEVNDSLGEDGDYFLTKDTKIIIGPKNYNSWNASDETEIGGSKFLTGSGAPSPILGDLNDIYYDSLNGELYGPKLLSGDWGTSSTKINRRIVQTGTGIPELDSSSLVDDLYLDVSSKKLYEKNSSDNWEMISSLGNFSSGNLSPNALTGGEGDYYLDKTTLIFYGPKNGNVWPVISSMNPIVSSNQSSSSFVSQTQDYLSSLWDETKIFLEKIGWFNVIFSITVILLIISLLFLVYK